MFVIIVLIILCYLIYVLKIRQPKCCVKGKKHKH